MLAAWWVGVGGFLGSVLRYAAGLGVQRLMPGRVFPYGTALINLTGCALIGLLAGWGDARGGLNPQVRAFVMVGVLGGFTTFSTFGYECVRLAESGRLLHAGASLLLQVAGGLAGVWLGVLLGRRG